MNKVNYSSYLPGSVENWGPLKVIWTRPSAYVFQTFSKVREVFVPSLDRGRHNPLVHFPPQSLRTNQYRSLQWSPSIFWLSVENVKNCIIWADDAQAKRYKFKELIKKMVHAETR